MKSEPVTSLLVTLPRVPRRGARPCRLGGVAAFAAWALLWGYFLAGIAAPAGRLAGARSSSPAWPTGSASEVLLSRLGGVAR